MADGRIARGAGWYGLSRGAAQVTQFLVGLALARLLTPADFGLVASVTVLTALGVVLFEGGLHSALIHAREPSEADYSTVFFLNAAGGVVLAVMVWACSPAIAAFYGQPLLADVAPIAGLTFALSLGVVNDALLQREFRFRASATVLGTTTITGLLVTLGMAAAGAGVYALVIGPLVAQVLGTTLYFVVRPWVPRTRPSWAALKGMLPYSLPLVGSTLLDYAGKNADTLLIARFAGPAPVGLYNRAYNLALLPVSQIISAMGNAVSPALARLGDDLDAVAVLYRRATTAVAFITAPLMFGMAAAAPGLVNLLWGPRWEPAVPLLQILSLAAVPQIVGSLAIWLYQGRRRTRTLFKMTVLATSVVVAGIVIGLQWGAEGVAWALLIRYWLGVPFELAVALRGTPLSGFRLFADMVMVALPAALMAAAVWLLPDLLGFERTSPLTAVVQVVAGVILQGGWALLFQRAYLREAVALVRRRG